MSATHVSYEARGWGEGELWLEGDRSAEHELPRRRSSSAGADHPLAERLVRYFAGERTTSSMTSIELEGATEFELALAEALRRVPRGETVTVRRAGGARRPAERAACRGHVLRAQPLLVFVPCHRVVAADGIGSYGSLGVEYKRRLLELEGVAV